MHPPHTHNALFMAPWLAINPACVSSWLQDLQGLIHFVPERSLHPRRNSPSFNSSTPGDSVPPQHHDTDRIFIKFRKKNVLVEIKSSLNEDVAIVCISASHLPIHRPFISSPTSSVHSDLFGGFSEGPRPTPSTSLCASIQSYLSSPPLLSALIYKYFPPIPQPSFHPSLDLSLSPITSLRLQLKWKMIRIIYSESERRHISPALSRSLFFISEKVMSTVWMIQHQLHGSVHTFEVHHGWFSQKRNGKSEIRKIFLFRCSTTPTVDGCRMFRYCINCAIKYIVGY